MKRPEVYRRVMDLQSVLENTIRQRVALVVLRLSGSDDEAQWEEAHRASVRATESALRMLEALEGEAREIEWSES